MERHKRHERNKGKDGLTSKVMRFEVSKDDCGTFIPYCNMSYHRGIVLKPEVCEARQCSHYRKLYLDGVGFIDERPKYNGEDCI